MAIVIQQTIFLQRHYNHETRLIMEGGMVHYQIVFGLCATRSNDLTLAIHELNYIQLILWLPEEALQAMRVIFQ